MLPKCQLPLLVCALLCLSTEFSCQTIVFENGRRYGRPAPSKCDADSRCVIVRRCMVIRNRPDWRSAGITCKNGYGDNRGVCCPKRDHSEPRVPQSPPFTVFTEGPERRSTHPRPRNPPGECGQSKTDNIRPFVMGGVDAEEGAWPWMVAITMRTYSGKFSPLCTGFLIDRKHVLSAAHCFHPIRDGLYSTRIGQVNQNQGEEYPVVHIAVPRGYKQGLYYDDIAILTLNREVNFPNFNPICLPNDQISRRNLTGIGATIAGWGANRPGGQMSYTLKQLSQIPIVSNQRCEQVFRDTITRFNNQFPKGWSSRFICAGFNEPGKDSCGGDSGAPLMYQDRNKWYAIGIVSFGYSCGLPGIPGGYTRVSSHLNWIRQNTRD